MSNEIATRTRYHDGHFCELHVELRDFDVLSITGTFGRVVTETVAMREALQYWQDFFEESPDALDAMNKRLGRRFRFAKAAAKFVIDTDGRYHGLDVHGTDPTGKLVLISESVGLIHDILTEWFPEVVPFIKWHLNDMHAECEHQQARHENAKDHLGAICPECGWKLGHGWHKHELPPEVVAWARSLMVTDVNP